MEKVTRIAIVIVMLATVGDMVKADEEPSFGFDLSMDYVGKYIYRGQILQDDGAFQPSLSLNFDKFTANIWGSMELSSLNDSSGEFTEIDYSLDYSDSIEGFEGVSYSLGLINYTFPNTGFEETTEVYAGFGFDLPLNPSATVYRDVDEADGTYVSVGISEEVEEIAPGIGLDFSASVGWGSKSYNKYYWTVDDESANDLVLSVGCPIALGEWTLRPSVNYVTLLDNDIRANDGSSDHLFIGVSLSTSF